MSSLEDLLSKLKARLLKPIIGAELECYMPLDIAKKLAFKYQLTLEQEKGQGQLEFVTSPYDNIEDFIWLLSQLQLELKKLSFNHPNILYSAKPLKDEYGNALHLHLNFLDYQDNNLLDDFNNLQYVASSICNNIVHYLPVYISSLEDVARISQPGLMNPTHVCWGNNNRTCMLRVPDKLPKRLEFRLPSPTMPISQGIITLLHMAFLGLDYNKSSKLHPQIFGNAFDPEYNLTQLTSLITEPIFKLS